MGRGSHRGPEFYLHVLGDRSEAFEFRCCSYRASKEIFFTGILNQSPLKELRIGLDLALSNMIKRGVA